MYEILFENDQSQDISTGRNFSLIYDHDINIGKINIKIVNKTLFKKTTADPNNSNDIL